MHQNSKAYFKNQFSRYLPVIGIAMILIGATKNIWFAMLYLVLLILGLGLRLLFDIRSIEISNGLITLISLISKRTYQINRSAIIDCNRTDIRIIFPDGKDAYIQRSLFSPSEWKETLSLIMNAPMVEQGAAANP
jgi:hypothetical protein